MATTKAAQGLPQLETTTKVPVDRLTLDRRNPRLIGIDERASDERIIAQLYRGEELRELLQSIAANGYLDIEPLVVMHDDTRRDRLIVLEGNRRLVTLRLFLEPELVDRIWTNEKLRISVPDISPDLIKTLREVSVYRVPNRDAARAFIGFKHINGAAKWNSYAKAKFAADWYRSGDHITLEEISDRIGDRHDTIKRMVAAIYVLEQASGEGLFDLNDRNTSRFNFSHLYTALSRKQYMDYLGLESAWSRYDPKPDPIPKDRLGALKEVLVWIYGSKDDGVLPVVQSQNPDIKRLGEVLVNAEALHVLRTTGRLSEAHSSTEPADAKLSAALIRSRQTLREASNNLRGYDGKDRSLVDIAEDIFVTAETVFNHMNNKYKRSQENNQ